MMQRLLADAGIRPGMRVLDVGCGYGRVARLVAEILGGDGEVVGVDRDPSVLDRAREDAPSNVRFVEADLHPDDGEPFDAVVGRRVLKYQPDVIDAVRRLVGQLKPGGVIAFQEIDATMLPAAVEPLPLHREVHRWIWETLERKGTNLHMGFQLHPTFVAAGVTDVRVRAEAIVQTPDEPRPIGDILRFLLPKIVEHGIATADEVDVDTIEERLTAELRAAKTSFIGDMVFGAWGKKPGAS